MLKYSEVKEIYRRAKHLYYDQLYDERNLARDMIEKKLLEQEIKELRQKLIDQQNYTLQLDRRENAEIQSTENN